MRKKLTENEPLKSLIKNIPKGHSWRNAYKHLFYIVFVQQFEHDLSFKKAASEFNWHR